MARACRAEASPLPRLSRSSVALAFVVVAISLSASSLAPLRTAAASDEVTYFLHSASPAGNPQSVVDSFASANTPVANVAVDGLGASMDASEPVNAWAKVAHASGLGNPDYRRNGLLMYWRGEVHGHLSDARATLHLAAPVPTEFTVTLFGDGGIGSGGVLARATRLVESASTVPVEFELLGAGANVDTEIVLSLSSDLPGANVETGEVSLDAGAAIFYDGVDHASSLTFSLGPFVNPPPPPPRTPAAGWSGVTLVNSSAAHRETSLAISPVDDDLMIACSPSGVPSTQNGQSYFHITRDGGANWEYLSVETGTTDPRRFAFEGGDCDVAFDAAGTMYSADTWLGSLSVGHSTDGGVTWTGTALAASAPIVDRPWLVGGPAGVLHVSWQDVQALMPSVVWYSRSTDYGLTFTPAVPITGASAEGIFTWEGNLVVSDDQQDLYLVYTRRAGPALNDLDASGPETVWVAASHDAGTTWTQHLVASMPNPASYLYPSIALDETGMLHVVFSSRTDVDRPIWYATSSDEADTWAGPVAILRGVAGYSPWIVATGPGSAAVQWYGTLDPLGNISAPNDWYFFTARIADGEVVSAGPTTSTPIFRGIQSAVPEFNQLRLDSQGRIHVGASAYNTDFENGGTGWAIFHQVEL